ncbi:MAG: hypothetical protein WC697_01405 [Patescibacteria group bacterium]|jgi:hypothetical protein
MRREGSNNSSQNLAEKKLIGEKLALDLEAEIMGRDVPEVIASIESISEPEKKKEILEKIIISFKTELEKLGK